MKLAVIKSTLTRSEAMQKQAAGFTLLELMLAMTLGALVLTVMLQLVLSLNRALQVQQSLGLLQSQARYAERQLADRASSAGFQATPWLFAALDTVAGSTEAGEGSRLVLRQWSSKNCLGNDNPVVNGTGAPEYFIRVSEWRLTPDNRLVETCFYGPAGSPGTRQLNASTRVEHVEGFRVQFAEDLDGDQQTDHWVAAGAWLNESNLLGLRFGLLFASPVPTGAPDPGTVQLLGTTIPVPDDGRLRLSVVRTVAFEGRRS